MAVEEIHDRPILEHDRCELAVDLLALSSVERRARPVQQIVYLLLAVARIVERLLAPIEADYVPVRIGTPAPRQHIGLEVALVGQLSEVANSVDWIFTSKPASLTIDWT